ncbi:MAG: hypothetical protein ACFE8J_10865 [Candidatus Heimdallarchaeota archaeon]
MMKEDIYFENSLISLELAKGISIILVIISNAFNFWIAYEYNLRYLYGYIFLILELFGVFFFIFLFSFSVIFTLNKKMGCKPEKVNRNKVIRQGLILILMGILFNIAFNPNLSFPLNFWGWNVISFIGISQIICFFAFKLVRWARLVIGLIILFFTAGIREILFIGKDTNLIINIIHFVLISPIPSYPILPYASFCFFSTVFGELVFEAKSIKSRVANLNALRSILKYCLIFILVGLLLPFFQSSPFITPGSYNLSKYPFLEAFPILEGYSFIYIPGMPKFLFTGSPSNLLLVIGISLLIFGLSFFIMDIKKVRSKLLKILIFFARYPISLLFLQLLFLAIFYQKIPIYLIFFIVIGYLGVSGLILYSLQRFSHSILNLEWLVKKLSGKTKDEVI